MEITRRSIMKLAGSGVVILASGGLFWRASSNGVFKIGEGAAYEPWADWEDGPKGPLALVRTAILSANAHNTQPWAFRVSGGGIDVYADTTRNLGAFDPYLREMYISLGCAIENMCIAAPASSLTAEVRMTAGNLGIGTAQDALEQAASVSLSPGSDLVFEDYDMLPRRSTHRGAYEAAHLLSEQATEEMRRLAAMDSDVRLFLFQNSPEHEQLGRLIIEATQEIILDEEMSRDSHRWFRMDWRSLQEHRDGVTMDAFGLPPLINALAKIAPALSRERSDEIWAQATRDTHVGTAPLLGMIALHELYGRPQNLTAGRLWQRLHLWATRNGISVQPLNQPVELVDRQKQLGQDPTAARALSEVTGDPDWRPTFVFRAGYALEPARLSPRRPIEDVVVNG